MVVGVNEAWWSFVISGHTSLPRICIHSPWAYPISASILPRHDVNDQPPSLPALIHLCADKPPRDRYQPQLCDSQRSERVRAEGQASQSARQNTH